MPLDAAAAQRAVASLRRESSFSMRRPLVCIAGLLIGGIVARSLLALNVKSTLEAIDTAKDANLVRALENDAAASRRRRLEVQALRKEMKLSAASVPETTTAGAP